MIMCLLDVSEIIILIGALIFFLRFSIQAQKSSCGQFSTGLDRLNRLEFN